MDNMYIKDHPYTDPTQIDDFNRVANSLGLKPLYLENQNTQGDTLEGVVLSKPEPTVDASFSIRDILKNTFGVLFDSVPHWGVSAQEVDMLSDAWGGAIDYWFPDMTEGLTPPANAYITTGIVFLPKLNKIMGAEHTAKTKPQKSSNATEKPEDTQTLGSLKQ